jgi:hypothetical protein
MPKLIITNPDGTTVKYGLNGRNFTIGRAENNDIVLPGGSSSNHHAVLKQTDSGDFQVTDLDSTNHTRVNHQVVQTSVLRNGDVLQFGDIAGHYESEFTAVPRIDEQPTQIYHAPAILAPPHQPAAPAAARAANPAPVRRAMPGGRAPQAAAAVGAADGCFAMVMIGILSLFAFAGGAWARHSSDHDGESMYDWYKNVMRDRQAAAENKGP